MNSVYDDLEQEIETLNLKCKESAVSRLAPENKEKIQDISKRIDAKLSDTSSSLNMPSLLIS